VSRIGICVISDCYIIGFSRLLLVVAVRSARQPIYQQSVALDYAQLERGILQLVKNLVIGHVC